jgi:hypothetical protein
VTKFALNSAFLHRSVSASCPTRSRWRRSAQSRQGGRTSSRRSSTETRTRFFLR